MELLRVNGLASPERFSRALNRLRNRTGELLTQRCQLLRLFRQHLGLLAGVARPRLQQI